MSVYVGATEFRIIEEIQSPNPEGFDTLTVRRKGARDDLETEQGMYKNGDVAPGHSSMYLFASSARDRGNFATLDLTYRGNLGGKLTDSGRIKIRDNIVIQTTALTTDTGESVQFNYYAQIGTTRWISVTVEEPVSPRYPIVLDSTIGVGNLFNPFPANYSGSVDFKHTGKLEGFERETLATGVWGVTESWSQRIEPTVTIVKVV